jgi:hypothetical protein
MELNFGLTAGDVVEVVAKFAVEEVISSFRVR